MEINKTQNGDNMTISLVGRLDTVTSPQLHEALIGVFQTAGEIELDLSELVYVSSAGLRVLLIGEKKAKASGKVMTLKNVQPEVMEVFEITGFSGIFNIK